MTPIRPAQDSALPFSKAGSAGAAGCLVKLWGTQNPRFFEGTRVAKEAAAVLAAAQTPTLAAAE